MLKKTATFTCLWLGSFLAGPGHTAETADEWFQQGYDHGASGQYEEAIAAYSKAIELDPRGPEAYYNRASAFGLSGDHQRAVEDFRKAAQLGHREARAYLRSEGIGWER